MAYAAAAKTNIRKDYTGQNTVTASIKHLRIGLDGIAEALQNMDFLEQITGMQISHNREMIELTIPDKTARVKIITEGLELDDIIKIDFRPDVPIIRNITFFNIPLELPQDLLHEELSKYGKVVASFQLKNQSGPI